MDENTSLIYNSRKYILEILEERGFDISEYSNFTINELNIIIQNNQLDILVNDSNEKKVYVRYHINKAIRQNNISEYIDDLFNVENVLSKKDDLIIIIKEEPNDTIEKAIKDIWIKDEIYVSIINIKRLQFNILKHSLVPKHILLSKEEEIEFKNTFNIQKNSEIPDIGYLSPVCQVLGVRPGNILKIIRPSRTSIDSIFYRICKL
jgi:DNA-directed RNA polymerase I, II, and III subunit RPABC1